jgi:hypothetical protein
MKNLLFLLISFTLLFSSCENDINVPEQPQNDIGSKIQRNYRITVDEAINNVNSLLDIIDNNSSSSGNVTMKATVKYRSIKDVSVVTNKPKTTGYTLMNATSGNVSETTDTLYYVINFDNDQGFAFASADSRFEPVFCITENGSYYEGDSIDNPGFAIFIAGLNDLILQKTAPRDTLLNPPNGGNDFDNDFYSLGPFELYQNVPEKLNMKWGQGYPYNNNCPVISSQKVPAGCVATAIAQIMSYYQYPTSHNGYTYNWNNICQHYSVYSPYSPAYSYLAHLFYNDIGLGVNMNYGASGSGTTAISAKNYLSARGYNVYNGVINYSDDAIINNLGSKLALASGTLAVNSSIGHMWVIDGKIVRRAPAYIQGTFNIHHYVYSTVVHCNWGWDGDGNGYFLSGQFGCRMSDSDIGTVSLPGEYTSYSYNTQLIFVSH